MTVKCECGEVYGFACAWEGPVDETCVVEWMHEYLRANHENAGNPGVYPMNGSIRMRVEEECAENILRDDPEWAAIVEEKS